MSAFFDEHVANAYDARNQRLQALQDNLHLMIQLVLSDLPKNAQILCVGAGTGTEIVKLASIYPEWRFVALEPSEPMLTKCKEKIAAQGLAERCEFFHGYLDAFVSDTYYDAVLALLVTQFVLDTNARQAMFNDMANRLNKGGYLINAEITGDMDAADFMELSKKWAAMHHLAGAPQEQLAHIVPTLRQHVAVVPPEQMVQIIKKSGLPQPIQFFQSLLIHAWYAQKKAA